MVPGTPRHASPERLAEARADGPSDPFALRAAWQREGFDSLLVRGRTMSGPAYVMATEGLPGPRLVGRAPRSSEAHRCRDRDASAATILQCTPTRRRDVESAL
jgi:hypothetical protein